MELIRIHSKESGFQIRTSSMFLKFHQIRIDFIRTLRRCAVSLVACLATSILLSKSLIPIFDFGMIFCFSIALSASFRSRSDEKRSDCCKTISTERGEEIGGTSSSELNTFVKPRSLNIDVCDVATTKSRRFCNANQQKNYGTWRSNTMGGCRWNSANSVCKIGFENVDDLGTHSMRRSILSNMITLSGLW